MNSKNPPSKYHLVEYSSHDPTLNLTSKISVFSYFQSEIAVIAYLPVLDKIFSKNISQQERLDLLSNHDHQVDLASHFLLCYLNLTLHPVRSPEGKSMKRRALQRADKLYGFLLEEIMPIIADFELARIQDLLNFYNFIVRHRFNVNLQDLGDIKDHIHPFTVNLLEELFLRFSTMIYSPSQLLPYIIDPIFPVSIRSELMDQLTAYHDLNFLCSYPVAETLQQQLIAQLQHDSLKFQLFSQLTEGNQNIIIKQLKDQNNLMQIALNAPSTEYSRKQGKLAILRIYKQDLLSKLVYDATDKKIRKEATRLLEYPTKQDRLLFNNANIFIQREQKIDIVDRNHVTLSQWMDLIIALIPMVRLNTDYFSHLRNFIFKIYDQQYLIELSMQLPYLLYYESDLFQQIKQLIIDKKSVTDIAFFKQQLVDDNNTTDTRMVALARLEELTIPFDELLIHLDMSEEVYTIPRLFAQLSDEVLIMDILHTKFEYCSEQVRQLLVDKISSSKYHAVLGFFSHFQSYFNQFRRQKNDHV